MTIEQLRNIHRAVPFSIGLLVTALGCYLPQFKRNWWAGIRTPWSLASEEAWNDTHQLAGPVFGDGVDGLARDLGHFAPRARSLVAREEPAVGADEQAAARRAVDRADEVRLGLL